MSGLLTNAQLVSTSNDQGWPTIEGTQALQIRDGGSLTAVLQTTTETQLLLRVRYGGSIAATAGVQAHSRDASAGLAWPGVGERTEGPTFERDGSTGFGVTVAARHRLDRAPSCDMIVCGGMTHCRALPRIRQPWMRTRTRAFAGGGASTRSASGAMDHSPHAHPTTSPRVNTLARRS